jgi:hypothetical protein
MAQVLKDWKSMDMYCYMLGFLGYMTSAPCCVTMGLLRFLSSATIKTETLLWLWRGDI